MSARSALWGELLAEQEFLLHLVRGCGGGFLEVAGFAGKFADRPDFLALRRLSRSAHAIVESHLEIWELRLQIAEAEAEE